MNASAASDGETIVVRRSARRSRTSSGVMSESPEAMTNSSNVTGSASASTASTTIRMSAAFLVWVRRGQSITSKPALTKNGRNCE